MIKCINVKEDHPPVDVAISRVLSEIEVLTFSNEAFLKVVHGYGSTGTGGEIKRQLIKELSLLKKSKKIFDFIKGEEFCSSHPLYEKTTSICPELILDPDLSSLNSGLTLIIFKKIK